WLHIADVMTGNVQRLQALVDAVRADGYTHALLLGMGGSSLAPEILRKTFGVSRSGSGVRPSQVVRAPLWVP
ncbi:MAG: glucose-6-phosphate isomerase, partial [Anaerolineae bacterium]